MVGIALIVGVGAMVLLVLLAPTVVLVMVIVWELVACGVLRWWTRRELRAMREEWGV